ncbi:MAG: hypothetical protein JEZ06_23160 [Anaerolineaceae bacterium]|nr:hypothetical protein [Anaerolineaceae bacterium]
MTSKLMKVLAVSRKNLNTEFVGADPGLIVSDEQILFCQAWDSNSLALIYGYPISIRISD